MFLKLMLCKLFLDKHANSFFFIVTQDTVVRTFTSTWQVFQGINTKNMGQHLNPHMAGKEETVIHLAYKKKSKEINRKDDFNVI